jgi:hypothetical protein
MNCIMTHSASHLQRLAAGVVGCFLLAAPAMAQTTITYDNSLFPDGSESMTINLTSDNVHDSNQSVGGIGYSTLTPVPVGDFITGATNLLWCTDIPQHITAGETVSTYNPFPLTTSNPGAQYPATPSNTQAGYITTMLYNGEANSSFTNGYLGNLSQGGSHQQSIWSAALQLAIWAVLYDTSTAGYNITSNSQNFYVNSVSGDASTAVSDANALLTCVSGGSCAGLSGWGSAPTGYSTYQFIDGGAQSMGLLAFNSGTQSQGSPVSEPSSLALLGAGLLALPLLRRRRATAARSA